MTGFHFPPSTLMVNASISHDLQMAFSADDARDNFHVRRLNTIQTAEAFQNTEFTFSTKQRQGWRLAVAKLLRQYRKPENAWILPLSKEYGW